MASYEQRHRYSAGKQKALVKLLEPLLQTRLQAWPRQGTVKGMIRQLVGGATHHTGLALSLYCKCMEMSSISRNHNVERNNYHKVPSDLHMSPAKQAGCYIHAILFLQRQRHKDNKTSLSYTVRSLLNRRIGDYMTDS